MAPDLGYSMRFPSTPLWRSMRLAPGRRPSTRTARLPGVSLTGFLFLGRSPRTLPRCTPLRRHQLATRDHARSPVAHGRGLFLGEHGFPGETSEPSEASDTADSQALLRHWHPKSAPRADDSRRPPWTTGQRLTALNTVRVHRHAHHPRSGRSRRSQACYAPVSGGRGIRTHETGGDPPNGFQDRLLYRL